jgi:hypothetical protein
MLPERLESKVAFEEDVVIDFRLIGTICLHGFDEAMTEA